MVILKSSKQNFDTSISALRIVATLAVIFLHTCNTLSNNIDFFNLTESQLHFYKVGNNLMNWAVPVFFMISGALLLNSSREQTYYRVFNKYVPRILLALFIFGVPMSWLEIYVDSRTITLEGFGKGLLNVITGNSWEHLWYLYSLIGLYLILPVLWRFVNHQTVDSGKEKNRGVEQEILLLLLFIFAFIIPTIPGGDKVAFQMPIATFAVFYFLVGKYLYDRKELLHKYRSLATVTLIICAAVIVVLSVLDVEIGYSNPLIAFLSVAVFSLFIGNNTKQHDERSSRLWSIDRLCFAVYLIHPVLTNGFYKFLEITPLKAGNLYPIATIGMWILFAILAFIESWILNSIPFFRKHVL